MRVAFSWWARRTGMLIVLLIAVAIYVAIISGVVHAAGAPGSAAFIAVLTAEAVFSVATAVLLIRRSLRLSASGHLTTTRTSRGGRTGADLGILASSAGGAAGAFLIGASALLSAGFMLTVTVLWLLPFLPTEQTARQRLAETLRLNHLAHPRHP